MAKKDKKKVNWDKRFKEGLRLASLRYMIMLLEHSFSDKNLDVMEKCFQYLKEGYNEIDIDDDVRSNMSYDDYSEFLNYMMDIYYSLNNSSVDSVTVLKQIKDRVVQKYKDRGTLWDFFVYTNIIGAKLDVYANRKGFDAFLKGDSTFTMLFAVYVTTYLVDIKNRYILEFYEEDGYVDAKYSSTKLLSNEEIDLFYQTDDFKGAYVDALNKVTGLYDSRSSDFSVVNIAKEYLNGGSNPSSFFAIKEEFRDLPFMDNGKYLLTLDELKKLPNDRLYLTPSAGVRFEFLNKDKYIDSIEMKESNNKIVFCVNIINPGGLYIGDTPEKIWSKNNKCNELILKFPFIVPVNLLSSSWTLKDLSLSSKYITCSPLVKDGQGEDTMINIMYTCLCCMYIAYYSPKMFSNTVKMYTINRNHKSGYNRSESFRIAHLRKLPKGQGMSDKAKADAKKFGFNYVPKGYTFVNASRVDLCPDNKTVIKVDDDLIK